MVKKSANGKKVLEEAIILFDEVNQKIDGLIDCSVKDFEILNSNFKNIFYNLQHLGEAANKIIKFVDLVCYNKSIAEYAESLDTSKDKILSDQNNNIFHLKQLDKTLNYHILLLSNIKQDLSTIKLLFTNLRFDPIISTDYNKIDKLLQKVTQFFVVQEKTIQRIRNEIRNNIRFAEEGIYSSTELLWEHIEKAAQAFKYLHNLSQNIESFKSRQESLEQKMNSSTSEIITNLQFQDILRQQIEHVQESHIEISSNLKNSHKEGETLTLEELYKIRDINSLQSAQLIHANREYQKAVEIILNRINELTSLFGQYNSFWTQCCKPEGVKLQSLQPVLSDLNTSLSSHLFSIKHLYEKFQNMIISLESDYYEFISEETNNKTCKELTELHKITSKINLEHLNNKEYNPITQIRNEIQKINEAYHKLINTYKQEHEKKISKTEPIKLHSDQGIEFIRKVTASIGELNEFFQNNSGILNLNIQIQKTESFSIEQVAYYKTFEKEVQEIISMLDNLLTNINLSRSELNIEELEHLKTNYTMESERRVHDLVTKNKKNKEETDIDDNDEVEFF